MRLDMKRTAHRDNMMMSEIGDKCMSCQSQGWSFTSHSATRDDIRTDQLCHLWESNPQ